MMMHRYPFPMRTFNRNREIHPLDRKLYRAIHQMIAVCNNNNALFMRILCIHHHIQGLKISCIILNIYIRNGMRKTVWRQQQDSWKMATPWVSSLIPTPPFTTLNHRDQRLTTLNHRDQKLPFQAHPDIPKRE